MKDIIITIDGYAGCGKSTTAKAVAKALGYRYIDSGGMYRAITLYFQENYVQLTNPKDIQRALAAIDIQFTYNPITQINTIYLNRRNVEEKIRARDVTEYVSQVSAIPAVRDTMIHLQQKLGKDQRIVMDGRDGGTTVFPHADLKIFMTADIEVRAERRQKEWMEQDQLIDFDKVKKSLLTRDRMDKTRKASPLKKAADAIKLDTTYMLFHEQVEEVLHLATSKILGVF